MANRKAKSKWLEFFIRREFNYEIYFSSIDNFLHISAIFIDDIIKAKFCAILLFPQIFIGIKCLRFIFGGHDNNKWNGLGRNSVAQASFQAAKEITAT